MKPLLKKNALEFLPLKFRFLDKIDLKDEQRTTSVRFIKKDFYDSEQTLNIPNYRLTSKLFNVDE
jgi:hypothetical protein